MIVVMGMGMRVSVRVNGRLHMLFLKATWASDVEVYSMPDYDARNLSAQGAKKTLQSCGPKLRYHATADAHCVMVMLDTGRTVPGRAVKHVQPADGAYLQKEL